MFNMSERATPVSTNIPSIKCSILFLLVYLFAIIPLASGIMYLAVLAGLPSGIIKANLPEGILTLQAILTAFMTYHLLRRYSFYLLSYSWKADFIHYLRVGLKWAIPLLAIHMIALAIPDFRDKLIGDYLSIRIVSVKGITNTSLVIFSAWVLFCAIFEEFIFRGIFLQKMTQVLNKNLSVCVVAGLFAFSHFAFSNIQTNVFTNAFLVGLFSGFAFVKTASCISAILPHLLSNAVCIGFILFIR